LLIIGFVSILANSKEKNYAFSEYKVKTAEMISAAKNPLIIADFPYGIGLGLRSFTAMLYECSSEKIDILRASTD